MNGIVYKATNKINDDCYIGQTIQLLKDRKLTHRSNSLGKNNKKYNSYFHRAIRKYGWDNFTWEILCKTDSESRLNALEKFYIAAYRTMGKLYNMTDGGEGAIGIIPWNKGKKCPQLSGENNSFYGKTHSEETRKKISIALIGKFEGKNNPNYGKILSEETKQKISKAKKGKPNWKKGIIGVYRLSEETKKKLSEIHKNKPKNAEWRKKISESNKGKHHTTPEMTTKRLETFWKNRKLKNI